MVLSTRLSLPLMAASQADKHVTFNAAITALDWLMQPSVKSRNLTTPPEAPGEADCFIPAAGARDAWMGHADDLAAFVAGGWLFVTPQEGWTAWDATARRPIRFVSGRWQDERDLA